MRITIKRIYYQEPIIKSNSNLKKVIFWNVKSNNVIEIRNKIHKIQISVFYSSIITDTYSPITLFQYTFNNNTVNFKEKLCFLSEEFLLSNFIYLYAYNNKND